MSLMDEKKLKSFREKVGPVSDWNDTRIPYTRLAKGQEAYRMRLAAGYCAIKDVEQRQKSPALKDETLMRATLPEFVGLLFEAFLRGADDPGKEMVHSYQKKRKVDDLSMEIACRNLAGQTMVDILTRK